MRSVSRALLLVCGATLSFAMTPNPRSEGGIAAAAAATAAPGSQAAPRALRVGATYARLEARFELPGLTGNPFDFTENDVRVTLAGPDGARVEVPAFFDGGTTWRMRYTPSKPGAYRVVSITRNGQLVDATGVTPKTLTASGPARPGFVRRSPGAALQFAYDNGVPYYPIGFNIGWTRDTPKEYEAFFTRMGASRLNWSRVWMCHWDGKNLDWVQNATMEPGQLSLDVARRWDALLESAEKHGVRVQVVLQHHGQYSSAVNPNWGENPWNAKNTGGFLATPEEFFTSEKARGLTRAKYRYILARYGAYDSVLAWELFNEVEWTDAIRSGKSETVAAWHREMADFLKKHDVHGHLVTTSSKPEIPGLYDAVDYVQPHHYPSDAVGAVMAHDSADWKKPVFVGEIGPQGDLKGDDGRFLRRALWSSMMTGASGAAQYWDWENVDARGLYGAFRSAADFAKRADLGGWRGETAYLSVTTAAPGSVSAGPGRGWEAAKRAEYSVLPSGRIEGIDEMPSFLQGTAHREMFPKATFHVRLEKPGQVQIRFKQIAKAGARVVLSVDGKSAAERAFPAAERDTNVDATVTADLPAGDRVVTLENTGADWAVVDRVTFTNAGSSRAALGKVGEDQEQHTVLYVWRTSGDEAAASQPDGTDTVTIGVGRWRGGYRVVWWDVEEGKEIRREYVRADADKRTITLSLPPQDEVAAIIVSGDR